MNLSDFIATTITEIIKGVQKASEYTSKNIGIYSSGNNNQRHVEFDIAVVVEDKNSQGREGGMNLRVLEFNSQGKNEHRDSSVSRVKFGLRIHDKRKKKDK